MGSRPGPARPAEPPGRRGEGRRVAPNGPAAREPKENNNPSPTREPGKGRKAGRGGNDGGDRPNKRENAPGGGPRLNFWRRWERLREAFGGRLMVWAGGRAGDSPGRRWELLERVFRGGIKLGLDFAEEVQENESGGAAGLARASKI